MCYFLHSVLSYLIKFLYFIFKHYFLSELFSFYITELFCHIICFIKLLKSIGMNKVYFYLILRGRADDINQFVFYLIFSYFELSSGF